MFSIQTTYTQARKNLAHLLNEIENDKSIAIIKRRGHQDIALISADELSSLLETLYLLRSPVNGQRLLEALADSQQWDQEKAPSPYTVDDLCEELNIER
ncbi:MAG: type II toxin-antitoxin system prevent-host-death family antitoxin [Cyanobacterium sp. T60_A2020_053]|nr:type II toxin-antitoxin system prevent-host-death family antitoxin [Cyanobacterium sp. T60_A2020_053]